MAQSFTAQLRGFENLTKQKLRKIIQASAQDVFAAAQTPQPSVKVTGGRFERGKVPVDWGDLRRSFISGLNGTQIAAGEESYLLAVAQADIGDVLQGGWTMEYAPAIEYGTEKIAPRAFVGDNVVKWQQIVRKNAALAEQMRA